MNTSNLRKYLDVSEEVQKALAEGRPVVALESTIISHGMPYPQNVETALNVEKVVRDNGAVPATIAIIGGKLKVGISKEEMEGFLSVYQKIYANLLDEAGSSSINKKTDQ